MTLHDGGDYASRGIAEDESHDNEDGATKTFRGEDSEVEEKNRRLSGVYCDFVYDLEHPKVLQSEVSG